MFTVMFRKRIVFTLFLCTLCWCQTFLYAQDPDFLKFGKVEMKELEMKNYPKDTSAGAVILSDMGRSYYTYVGDEFQVNLERHVKIKILKKSDYKWADVRIVLYKSGTTVERVSDLKGFTYNLENGKMVKTKLEKEQVFEEKYDENHVLKKFTMPAVREGSVIEYTYTVKSEFYWTLPEWEFQNEIPVLWSEYRAIVPEFFIFKQYGQGYEPYYISKMDEGRESFAVHYRSEDNNSYTGSGRTPGGIQNVEAKTTKYRWVMKDVPAIQEEPYMTTLRDYIAKIEFEITGTKFGAILKTWRNTWDDLAKNLLESEYFGTQLNRTGFIRDEITGIKTKFTDPAERVAAICAFVKKTMKWDGRERLYPETTLKKAYENRTGNSADINLLLVAMLKEAGLDANPVILSTRDHGRVPFFPLITKFNYVIAHVELNGKSLLLDATEPYASHDMLPRRCLNGSGRLIAKSCVEVNLYNNEKYNRYCSAKLALKPTGELSGLIEESEGGYTGFSNRKDYNKEGKEKYIESLKKKLVGWDIENLDIKNVEKVSEVFQTNYNVTIGEHAQAASNLIYINPLLHRKADNNPFKLEERKFPVDFAAPTDETYILTLSIPEGYQVEELPKATIVSLPDGAGKFTYNVNVNGNTLQVVSKLSIRKTMFIGDEYQYLREFYNHIVTKHSEQVVLKKKG
jgi:hypothetical protein